MTITIPDIAPAEVPDKCDGACEWCDCRQPEKEEE